LKFYSNCFTAEKISDIQVVSIEFCAICNLDCRYCFLEKRNRPSFLALDIYEKLLNELCENMNYAIKILEWPISGCFFLHPDYREIIAITREYKDKYRNFKPWIILNDNMMLFEEEKVDFILENGIVNQIICSIDGVDKETFERMRPGADFETVLKHTSYLLSKNRNAKNRAVIQVNNGCDFTCNLEKIDARLEQVFYQADHLTRWEPSDWNDSFHTQNERYVPANNFCSFVFESVSLSTAGAIIKCCMDLQESTRYGDFTKHSLESIWLSQARKDFLRLMHVGKRHLIPGCNKCSIGYVSQNRLAYY